MFNEKQINTYKNISAPRELRERVLNAEKQPTVSGNTSSLKAIRNISLIAACLAIIVTSVYFFNSKETVSVFVNGSDLSKGFSIVENSHSAYALAQANETENLEICLDLYLQQKSQISVNDGILLNYETKTVSLENNTQIVWSLQADREKEYFLEIASEKNTCTVMLIFDNTENYWKIFCSEQ